MGPSSAWLEHERFLREALPNLDRHELSAPEFADWLLKTLRERALFPGQESLDKRVPQLTVFTYLCAPRTASRTGLIAAAEFLFVFFLFNDYWSETGAQFSGSADFTTVDPRVSFVRGWLSGLEQQYGTRARRFLDSFRRYHAGLQVERDYIERAGHPTFEEYLDKNTGRYQWVATAPYLDLWELVEELDVPEEQRSVTEPLKDLAVELTYLANDIGSVLRDDTRHNYVRLLQSRLEPESTLEQALSMTADLYRHKAAEFAERARELRRHTVLLHYADMLAHVTDGNLSATLVLSKHGPAGRYSPLVRSCLAALPALTLELMKSAELTKS